LMPTDALADEAEKLLANGFRAIKLRLGYPTLDEDLAAVHAVQKRIPEECRADGRLQSGAQQRRSAEARPRA
jgi:mandelate racemase